MAALVESLAYVSNEENGRFVPWHGLGTPVLEAMTSAEAIEKAGLNWEVEARPILDSVDGNIIPNYFANTRTTDGSVFGIVTDRYNIVQNSDAFSFTDSLVGEGVTYETAGSLKGGKQIFLLAKMPKIKLIDDDVEPFICFTNSHDGFGAIKVCATPIRVVCNNTLNLALRNAKRTWSTKHIGDIQGKLEEAKMTLNMANNYLKELDETAYKLADTKLEDEKLLKILNELIPVNEKDSDRIRANKEQAKEMYVQCLLAPDIAKFRGTAWGAINAMSDFTTHKAPKRNTDTYRESQFITTINGQPLMDALLEKILIAA